MTISTRLTRFFSIRHPILSAPMALASGGALAAAVSRAGGLGLIGGGYGDAQFIETAFRDAGNEAVGAGFITWSLAKKPELLEAVLVRKPRALMLSFGDPAPFAGKIAAAGVPLICQCQTMEHLRQALDCGAAIVVAQGSEAGGHGATRGTLSFAAEAADHLAKHSPEVLLLAAGGIADGRGLAAALMLGADGVLMGTRFWAAEESLAPRGHIERAVARDGDSTLRTDVVDIIRQLDWPEGYSIRVGKNAFTERWHGQEADLRAALEREIPAYKAALAAGDAEHSAPVYGEAAGLIHAIEPAGAIIERIVVEAEARLRGHGGAVLTTGE
jgi:nitronate monooxygenase